MVNVKEYITNVAKSTIYTVADVYGDTFKETKSFITENNEVFKEAYSAVKDYRITFSRIKDQIQKNDLYVAANIGINSLLEDIKTGNFYNKEREDELTSKYGGDLASSMFDMDDGEFDWDDGKLDMSDGDKVIATAIKKNSKISTVITADAIAKSTKTAIDAGRENTTMLYVQNERMLAKLGGGIDRISSILTQSTEINRNDQKVKWEKTAVFYKKIEENSNKIVAQLDELLKMQRNLYAKEREEEKAKNNSTAQDLIENSFNLKDYGKQIKKNITDYINEQTGMGSIGSMLEGGNAMALMAGDLGKEIAKSIVKSTTDKTFKNVTKDLDESFSSILYTIMGKLESAKKSDKGLEKLLGTVFGLKSDKMSDSIETDKYKKDAIQFDGVTKRAIIDVIPHYLRKMTSFITGEDEEVYDYNTGKYVKLRAVRQHFAEWRDSAHVRATSDLKDRVYGIFNKSGRGFFNDKDAQERFDKDFKRVMAELYRTKDFASLDNPGLNKDVVDVIKKVLSISSYDIKTEVDPKTNRTKYKGLNRDGGKTGIKTDNVNNTKLAMDVIRSLYNTEAEMKKSMADYQKDPNNIYKILFEEGLNTTDIGEGAFKSYVNKYGDIDQKAVKKSPLIQSLLLVKDKYDYDIFDYLRFIKKDLSSIRNIGLGGKKTQAANSNSQFKENQMKFESEDFTLEDETASNKKNSLRSGEIKYKEKKMNERASYEREQQELIKKYEKASPKQKRTMIDPRTYIFDMSSDDLVSEMGAAIQNSERRDEDEQRKRDYIAAKENKIVDFLVEWGVIDSDKGKDLRKISYVRGDDEKSLSEQMKDAKDGLSKLMVITSYTKQLANKPWDNAVDAIVNTHAIINDLFFKRSFKIKNEDGDDEEYPGLFAIVQERFKDGFKSLSDKVGEQIDKIVEKFAPIREKYLDPIIKGLFGEKADSDSDRSGGIFGGFIGKVEGYLRQNSLDVAEMVKETANTVKKEVSKVTKDDDDDNTSSSSSSNTTTSSTTTTSSESESTPLPTIPPIVSDPLNGPTSARGGINKTGKPFRSVVSSGEIVNGNVIPPGGPYITTIPPGGTVINPADENTMSKQASQEKSFLRNLKTNAKANDNLSKIANDIGDWLTNGEYSDMVANAIAKGGIGAAIGTLLGGPLVGAGIGIASGIADKSDSFSEALFGRKIMSKEGQDTGKRDDTGLFSQEIQNAFPDMKKGGLIGGALGLLTPLGPVGGLMVGSAIGFAKNNELLNDSLFGEEGLIGKDADKKIKKALPRMGLGALAGTLTLGGPLGLVGGAILGATGGFVSTTDKFKELVFGKDMLDKDGNPTGKKYGGLMGSIKNAIDPLKDFGRTMTDAITDAVFGKKEQDGKRKGGILGFVKDSILVPLASSIQPIVEGVKHTVNELGTSISDKLRRYLNHTVGLHFRDSLSKGAGIVGKAAVKVGKTALYLNPATAGIMAGVQGVRALGSLTRQDAIKKGTADYMTAKERLKHREKNKFWYTAIGRRDEYKDNDQILADMSENMNVDQIDNLRSMIGQAYMGEEIYENDTARLEQEFDQQISQTLKGTQVGKQKGAKQIMKLVKAGEYGKAEIMIKGALAGKDGEVTPEQREQLLNLLKKLKKDKEAVRARQSANKKMGKEELMRYVSESGLNVDLTDRKSVNRLLENLKTESLHKKAGALETEEENKSEEQNTEATDKNTEALRELTKRIDNYFKLQNKFSNITDPNDEIFNEEDGEDETISRMKEVYKTGLEDNSTRKSPALGVAKFAARQVVKPIYSVTSKIPILRSASPAVKMLRNSLYNTTRFNQRDEQVLEDYIPTEAKNLWNTLPVEIVKDEEGNKNEVKIWNNTKYSNDKNGRERFVDAYVRENKTKINKPKNDNDDNIETNAFANGSLSNIPIIGKISDKLSGVKSGIRNKIVGSKNTRESEENSFRNKVLESINAVKDTITNIKNKKEEKNEEESRFKKIAKRIFGIGKFIVGVPLMVGFMQDTLLPFFKNKIAPILIGTKNQEGEYEGGICSGIVNPIRKFFAEKFQKVKDWVGNKGEYTDPNTGSSGLFRNIKSAFESSVDVWKSGLDTIINKWAPVVVESICTNLPNLIIAALKGAAKGLYAAFTSKDSTNVGSTSYDLTSSYASSSNQQSNSSSGTSTYSNLITGSTITFPKTSVPTTQASISYNAGRTPVSFSNVSPQPISSSENDIIASGTDSTGATVYYSKSDTEKTNPLRLSEDGNYYAANDLIENVDPSLTSNEAWQNSKGQEVTGDKDYTGIRETVSGRLGTNILRANTGAGLYRTGIKASGSLIQGTGNLIRKSNFLPAKGVGNVVRQAGLMTNESASIGNKLFKSASSKVLNQANEEVLNLAVRSGASKNAIRSFEKTAAEEVAQNAAKSATKTVAKADASLVSKIIDILKKTLDKLVDSSIFKKFLQKFGKKAAESAAMKAVKNAVEKIVKPISEKLLKAGGKAIGKIAAKLGISTALAATGVGILVDVAFIVADYISGVNNARNILKISTEPTDIEEAIAGISSVISGILIIWQPSSFTDIVATALGGLFNKDFLSQIQEDQKDTEEALKAWNQANGQDLSIEEYNKAYNPTTAQKIATNIKDFFTFNKNKEKEVIKQNIDLENDTDNTSVTESSEIVTNARANSKLSKLKDNKLYSSTTNITTNSIDSTIDSQLKKASRSKDINKKLERLNNGTNKKINAGTLGPMDKDFWKINVGDEKGTIGASLYQMRETMDRIVKAPFATVSSSMSNITKALGGTESDTATSSSSSSSSSSTSSSSSGTTTGSTSFLSKIKNGIKKIGSTISSWFTGKGIYGKGTDDGHIYQRRFNMPYNTDGDTERQTVADSGCGPVAAAAVLNKYGANGNVNEAAKFALNNDYKEINGGTYPEFFSSYLGNKGIAAAPTNDNKAVINSLINNKPVVLMGNDPTNSGKSPYADQPHYVVATGLDSNGKVIVEDSESRRGGDRYDLASTLKNSNVKIVTGVGHYGRGETSIMERYMQNTVNAAYIPYKTLMEGIRNMKISSSSNAANTTTETENTSSYSQGTITGEGPQAIWDFFMSKGYSKNLAAGIMGNMKAESGFQVNIIEGGASGDIYSNMRGGYGLVQFTGVASRAALYNWCKKHNLDPDTMLGQLEYINAAIQGIDVNDEYDPSDPGGFGHSGQGVLSWVHNEILKGHGSAATPCEGGGDFNRLNQLSLKGATEMFLYCYERPRVNDTAKRLGYAQEVLNTYGAGTGKFGTGKFGRALRKASSKFKFGGTINSAADAKLAGVDGASVLDKATELANASKTKTESTTSTDDETEDTETTDDTTTTTTSTASTTSTNNSNNFGTIFGNIISKAFKTNKIYGQYYDTIFGDAEVENATTSGATTTTGGLKAAVADYSNGAKGIDISHHNGTIDFTKLASSGISFVIIKIGQRDFVDSKFEQYYSAAVSAGLNVGGYWYLDEDTSTEAASEKEAKRCIEAVAGKQFNFPIWLDYEGSHGNHINASVAQKTIPIFLQTLVNAGLYTGIYSSASWFATTVPTSISSSYDVWVASVGKNGAALSLYNSKYYSGSYTMWQYSWVERPNGTNSNTDGNYCYVDYPSIIASKGMNGYGKGRYGKGSKYIKSKFGKAINSAEDAKLAGVDGATILANAQNKDKDNDKSSSSSTTSINSAADAKLAGVDGATLLDKATELANEYNAASDSDTTTTTTSTSTTTSNSNNFGTLYGNIVSKAFKTNKVYGQFYDTLFGDTEIANMSGTTSGGYSTFTGNANTVTMAAQVFYAVGIVPYSQNTTTTIEINGKQISVRHDCSGFMSAIIKGLGYLLGSDGDSCLRSYDFIQEGFCEKYIKNADGTATTDWIDLPYSKDTVQPGDIIAYNGHAEMYWFTNPNGKHRGFSSGSSEGIARGYNAGKHLSENGTMTESDGYYVYDTHTRIVRFVGNASGGIGIPEGCTYNSSTGTGKGNNKVFKLDNDGRTGKGLSDRYGSNARNYRAKMGAIEYIDSSNKSGKASNRKTNTSLIKSGGSTTQNRSYTMYPSLSTPTGTSSISGGVQGYNLDLIIKMLEIIAENSNKTDQIVQLLASVVTNTSYDEKSSKTNNNATNQLLSILKNQASNPGTAAPITTLGNVLNNSSSSNIASAVYSIAQS